MRKLIAFSLAIAVVAGGVLLGCQGYQFEEVTPKAIGTKKQVVPIVGVQKPAKIMLVLDRSGSMKSLVDNDGIWGCSSEAGGSGWDPAGNCKWNTLRDKFAGTGGFLDQTATTARHGLVLSADPDGADKSCGAGTVKVPVPAAAGASIGEIRTALTGTPPNGGTPTAASLRNVASDSTFTKQEQATKTYVLLITDGMPNCNSSLSSCTACTNPPATPDTTCGGDPRNCLDDLALVSAVKTLKAKGVDTFVVGFGSAFTNPDAKRVLNQAADEGGQATSDPNARFFLADNDESLQKVLDQIKIRLQACNFALDQAPADPALLEVTIKNTKTGEETKLKGPSTPDAADGEWSWADKSYTTVTMGGTWCQTLQNAEPDTYSLNFTSVREL